MEKIPDGLKRARHEMAVEKAISSLLASLPEGARLPTLWRVEADTDTHDTIATKPKQRARRNERSDVILELLSDGMSHLVDEIAAATYGEENSENNNRTRSLLGHLKTRGLVEYVPKRRWRLVDKTPKIAVAPVIEESASNEPALSPRDKPVALHKDKSIRLRCTAEQKDVIEQAATRAGLTISGWLLTLGLREAKRMNAAKLTVVKG